MSGRGIDSDTFDRGLDGRRRQEEVSIGQMGLCDRRATTRIGSVYPMGGRDAPELQLRNERTGGGAAAAQECGMDRTIKVT